MRPRIRFVSFSISSSFFKDDDGENEAVVFFQILFKRSCDVGEFLRVFHVFFVIRLQNLVLLFLAVGQTDILGCSPGGGGGGCCAGSRRAPNAAGTSRSRVRRMREWIVKSPTSVSYRTYK